MQGETIRARRQRRRPALPYTIASFGISVLLVGYLRWRYYDLVLGDYAPPGEGMLALGLTLYGLLIMYRLEPKQQCTKGCGEAGAFHSFLIDFGASMANGSPKPLGRSVEIAKVYAPGKSSR